MTHTLAQWGDYVLGYLLVPRYICTPLNRNIFNLGFVLGQTDDDDDFNDNKASSQSSLDLSAHETQIHEESDWKGPTKFWKIFFYLKIFELIMIPVPL